MKKKNKNKNKNDWSDLNSNKYSQPLCIVPYRALTQSEVLILKSL